MKKNSYLITVACLFLLLTSPGDQSVRADASNQDAREHTARIAGIYDVRGTNTDEANSPYTGQLQIIERGDVYQFKWTVGDQYEGVGVVNGNFVGVAWTTGANGSGCGVVSYRVAANGTLDGIWGMWGVSDSGTERAVRIRGTGLIGTYRVTGTNPDKSPYETSLTISAAGKGYAFHWGNNASGIGIKEDDVVSVGFGGAQCAWVAYEIKPAGILDGVWGSSGTYKIGTERAIKRR